MNYLCDLFNNNKNKNKNKVCNLDEIHTIPQIKKIINNHSLELYNQIIDEGKSIKLFITEYDETEPEILIEDPYKNVTCKHLAFVAEINTIYIENQKKKFLDGKIVYNKDKNESPVITKRLIDGVVCDIHNPKNDVKYYAKCSYKFYWLYKKKYYHNSKKYSNQLFARGNSNSITIQINQSLEILLPELLNYTISCIEKNTLKEIFDGFDLKNSVNYLIHFATPYVSSCNWIIPKKQIEQKENNEETELTELLNFNNN